MTLMTVAAGGAACAQTLPPTVRFDVPFDEVRRLLPPDGQIIYSSYGAVEWREFGEENPFERCNPSFEVALGKGIRAKSKHRNPEDERPLGPGLEAADGHLLIRAGWRAKIKARFDDHFDGAAYAKASLEVNEGKVSVRIYDIQLTWNKGPGDEILDRVFDIRGKMEAALKAAADRQLNTQLTQLLDEKVQELLRKEPKFAQIRDHVYLRVEPGKLVVSLISPAKSISARLPTMTFIPPHVRGDGDFDGDPHVRISVKLDSDENGVSMRVFMSAKEQVDDWTTAEGWSPSALVCLAPAGWKVQGFPGRTEYLDVVNQVVGGHSPVDLATPLGMVTVYGDRDGDEAGTYTRVVCRFDYEVHIALTPDETARPASKTETATFPRSMTLVPPHTRGDREFDGCGPRVWIHVQIIQAETSLSLRLYMKAEETEDDWTTGEGWSEPLAFFTAPPGYRIKEVGSPNEWLNIVQYTDSNHDPDVFNTALGRIACYGDRDGDDIGEYTRVVASFDHSVPVTLVRTDPPIGP
ncbi:hypothetical protein [Paludisphaera mucosa]|uniref:Uncharacterized protein n=1 Tax=Paludisphaera mucosa TaxID=3030827 RepID=A0ABT6F4D9_9BACT|nr:hypothetical protein [Paludisphaera mucosa]MDG3002424.1 hypothetical protein [Paludisphaera mucosa]